MLSFARILCLVALVGGPLTANAAANSGEIAEIVYDSGLKNAWQDWGWAPRTAAGGPARLKMGKYAGWILAKRGLMGNFGAVGFDLKAPNAFGDFLEVYLTSDGDESFKHLPVSAAQAEPQAAGFVRVRLPMQELNPNGSPFDRIVFRAIKGVGDEEVLLDKIVLFAGGPPPAPHLADASTLPSHKVRLHLDCRAPTHPISPYIYGIAFNPQRHGKDAYLWDLGPTIRRWGGNNTSRYNWKLGNAWNAAFDYFFQNANYTNDDAYSWKNFLAEDAEHHVGTALTLPMLGWVAKDTESASFPVSLFGEQQYAAGDNGNGKRPNGSLIPCGDPTRTSVPASPAFVGEWVRSIAAYDKGKSQRSVTHYIMDNEPALWNSTHRDVHPQALTYDELLKKTVDYATVVRKADPQALIAGPAEWGWPNYFFSARDAEVGFAAKPDRLAHGDEPLLAWYLRQLRAHQKKTGTRLLDILDLHFYPQADGVYGHPDRTDPAAAALRLRATRGLWDPTYRDESWINDAIELLPRMRRLIAENYPGLKISIGEYNFGGERHISGGLAQAEALGRFAQADVYSAYYWTYPPQGSAAAHAFMAYRNYDQKGGHFLANYVPARGDRRTSIFASTNAARDRMVLVVLNLDPQQAADVQLDLGTCGAPWRPGRSFAYAGGAQGLLPAPPGMVRGTSAAYRLLPYSINVLELQR